MNHYKWLEENLPAFFEEAGVSFDHNAGIISCHGDKCYGYRDRWMSELIPFEHGVAIYLLSYCSPYSSEVRDTSDGWVDPSKWVIDNYNRFKNQLEGICKA